jgi:hypothetical protein
MKNISLAFIFFIFSTSAKIIAQAKDSVPVKKVAEKGAQGDIILGKQDKKTKLNNPPQKLEHQDSLQKEASTQPKRKKSKTKSQNGD